MTACKICGHDRADSERAVNEALHNEQHWIDIALATAAILERVSLAAPEGPEREEGLAQVAAIRTTPMLNAKAGPHTRKYSELHHRQPSQPALAL